MSNWVLTRRADGCIILSYVLFCHILSGGNVDEPKYVRTLSVRLTDRDDETLSMLMERHPNKTQSEIIREILENARRGIENTETKTDVMFAVMCLVGGENEDIPELKRRVKDMKIKWKDEKKCASVSTQTRS